MKVFLVIGICVLVLDGFSQEKDFLLKGRILDPDSVPVENAYIINFRDASAYLSRRNGQYNIMVKTGDSLMITHISFLRKKIYADSVRIYPDVVLEYERVMIKQVIIGEDLNRIIEKNLASLRNMNIIIYKRMNPGTSLVNKSVTENNRILRWEASSLSFPLHGLLEGLIASLPDNTKKLQKQKGFNFYRSEEQKERKEK